MPSFSEDERLCNRCGKPFYEEDLDEEGLCEECRVIEAGGEDG